MSQRYQYENLIGSGGTGEVFRAYDRLKREYVAVKRINSHLPVSANHFATPGLRSSSSPSENLLLTHEFRMLAQLRHPHIIRVSDYGFDDLRRPYLVMQLLEDAVPITKFTRQDQEGTLDLIVQVLEALQYLHRFGVIHRDLKPENIMVLPDKTVKLLDFGLALDPRTQSNHAGTLAYMAPEVLRHGMMGVESDLYAMGIVMYEMFAQRHPYSYVNTTQLMYSIMEEVPDLTRVKASAEIRAVIKRLLLKKPDERYHSAQEVIDALTGSRQERYIRLSSASLSAALDYSKFIGRKAELARLQESLNALSDKNPQGAAWLIAGESGIGKSRLVDELRIRAMVNGVLVLSAQATDSGGFDYSMWHQLIRQLIMESELSLLDMSVLQDIVPDLTEILELDEPIEPASVLKRDKYQIRLAATIADMIKLVKLPILLIIEDIHWAKNDIEIIEILTRLVHDNPILIVANYRPEEAPSLKDKLSEMRFMPLKRLSEEEIRDFTLHMLGERVGERPEIVNLVSEESEGNTFFMIEVIRALAEESQGLESIGSITLPQTVFTQQSERLIARRLAYIAPEDKDLLYMLALVGRDIDEKLAAYLEPERDLESWIYRCADAMVLEAKEEAWRFSHDKLRESTIHSIPAERLAALSLRLATAIESLYVNELERFAFLLAKLWHQIGDLERERHYTYIAGERALNTGALVDARDLFERCVELDQLISTTTDQDRVYSYRFLGMSYQRLGDFDTADHYWNLALEYAVACGDRTNEANAYTNLADMRSNQAHYQEASAYFEKSIAICEEIGAYRELGFNMLALTRMWSWQDEYQKSYQCAVRAVELLREYGDLVDLGNALNNLGNTSASANQDHEAAMAAYEESIEIRRRIGDRHGIASSLYNTSFEYELMGDKQKAFDHRYESLQMMKSISGDFSVSVMLSGVAQIAFDIGKVQLAYDLTYEKLRLCERLKIPYETLQAYSSLSLFECEAGQHQSVIEYVQKALAIDYEWSDRSHVLSNLLGNFVRSLLALGYQWPEMALLAGWVSKNLASETETERFSTYQPLLQERLGVQVYEAQLAAGRAADVQSILKLAREVLDRFYS